MCSSDLIGEIKPIQNAEELGYELNDVIGPDKWIKETTEESGIGQMSGTISTTYKYSDASIQKNREGSWILHIDDKFIGGYRTREIAKQVAEYYDKNPNKIPKVEAEGELTNLQKATKNRKAARERLNSLRQGLGINPNAKVEALVDYHRALVAEAKEFIKEKKGELKDWASSIGEKANAILKKAWDEASGIIPPVQKSEELGYTFDDAFGIEIGRAHV